MRALLDHGYSVRAVVRSAAAADRLRALGCDPALADAGNQASLRAAFGDAQAVVHLIGVLRPEGGLSVDQINRGMTENAVRAAEEIGLGHFVFMSAVGSRPDTRSEYFRSKWGAEEAVRRSRVPHTIFRSSYMYGPGGDFIRLMANLTRLPIVPVVGRGRQKVSPVYVGDNVACILKSLDNDSLRGTYETCGPDTVSFNELIDAVAQALGRSRRPKLHLPAGLVRGVTGIGQALAPSLVPLTTDALDALLQDNTCDRTPLAQAFEIEPTPLEEGLRRTFASAARPGESQRT